MNEEHILICYVTFPDASSASKVGKTIVESGLAACVNYTSVHSCYVWELNFEKDDEVIALFKSLPELESELRKSLEGNHPYEVPCILSWTVKSNPAYKKWVQSQTNS